MQNSFDYRRDPAEFFLNPATDAALRPVGVPAFFWREMPRARIQGFAASGFDEVVRKIEGSIAFTNRHKTFARAVEFNTIPVVLREAVYWKNFVFAGGRAVLNGASGVRLLNRYLWENHADKAAAEERLADWFDRCQAAAGRRPFQPADADIAGLPFATEARNTFNYFHFMTETLGQFCLLDELGHDRPLFVHHPDHPDKTRGFTRAFLRTLFPEFGDRVVFTRTPHAHGRVLTGFNLMNAWYQYPDRLAPPLDPLISSRTVWSGRRALRRSQGVLQANAVDTNLLRLRERGLRAIEGQDFSHLPRRFWVGRDPGQARKRTMVGEEMLVEALRPLGFARVTFESLSPLEQIAIMARAEVMIGCHGAGFTNMLFANPAAQVIEIGTLQTAQFRWGDFWRLAHAAGCTYTSFFADFAGEDPLAEPEFSEDGIVPVRLTRRGLDAVMAYVTALVEGAPRLSGRDEVLALAQQLNAAGEHARTLELFERHPGVEDDSGPLCLALAEALHAAGRVDEELAALRAAHAADPGRAFTLVQMVWRAQKAGRADDLAWAIERMRQAFPERLDELLRARPHLRRAAMR